MTPWANRFATLLSFPAVALKAAEPSAEGLGEVVCPYGWMSACGPLLLGGGVRGGREKSGHNVLNKYVEHCLSATTPHPSFPKEGTTLGALPLEPQLCCFEPQLCCFEP